MNKAVVLLSGGLDSTTTLAIALNTNDVVIPIVFDYEQRHKRELLSAKQVCDYYGLVPVVVQIDFRVWANMSALTSDQVNVPDYVGNSDVPVTYVPARNMVFLSIACSVAESVMADYVYYGANALDYSGYPDCRPDFVSAMQVAAREGMQSAPLFVAPLIDLKKEQIIDLAVKLEAPLHLTWSCYRGENVPCGTCDSCVLRQKGFEKAGISDPAL